MIYGLYGVVLNQGPLMLDIEWKIITFNCYLAEIGGYAAAVWAVVTLLTKKYQAFRYNNSILAETYKRDKTGSEIFDVPKNLTLK